MKIRITENTIVNGKHAAAGSVLDVDRQEARKVFVAQKAIPLPEGPKKPTTRKKPVTTKTAASTIKGKAKAEK